MPDEDNVGGGTADMNEGMNEDEQQSAQPREEEGAMEGSSGEGGEGSGEREQGQSNIGDWNPAQQSGGGGELY